MENNNHLKSSSMPELSNQDIQLCSGYGQFHSPKNPTNPQDYITITLSDIINRVKEPQSVYKKGIHAQWFIPTTLLSRVHKEQKDNGKFYALWPDIDKLEIEGQKDKITFSEIVAYFQNAILPNTKAILYTTASATPDNQKSRIIVPLAEPVDGHTFIILQTILNDKLMEKGITPDRANQRANQICFLPNKGIISEERKELFYQHEILDGQFFNHSVWQPEIEAYQERLKIQAQEQIARQERAKQQVQERIDSGQANPMQAYKDAYPVETALEMYGYEQCGDKWLSPNSESGNAGVIVRDKRWISKHGSDSAIGKPYDTGTWGDAFDLFVYYECNGDFDEAVRRAGSMFYINGKTITKYNQIDYAKKHSGAVDSDVEQLINNFNSKFGCVLIGGKFRIIQETTINTLEGNKELITSFLPRQDFKNWHENLTIEIEDKIKKQADIWLSSKTRKNYKGIVFDPNLKDPEYYNYWKGFSIKPKQGDWSLMQQLINEGIADNNPERANWIKGWFAHLLQYPGKKIETTPVLMGGQGVGKGSLIKQFKKILGIHYYQTQKGKQITGNFNNHMKNILLLYANEAVWGGNKQDSGVLKGLITEPFFDIEAKGLDSIQVANRVNIIMDSNKEWVCPAESDERRFNVIKVNDKFKQDLVFFKALNEQMDNGGTEAMMYDLLNFNLTGVNLREIEHSEALFTQILKGMDSIESYWYERLYEGDITGSEIHIKGREYRNQWDWQEPIPTQLLKTDYENYAKRKGIKHTIDPRTIKAALKKFVPDLKTQRAYVNIETVSPTYSSHCTALQCRCSIFPSLEICRQNFADYYKMDINTMFDED